MIYLSFFWVFTTVTTTLAAPAPDPKPIAAPELVKRAGACTFTGPGGAASVKASKRGCSTITLSALSVPAGTTLDLSDLNKGTHVIFEGETTFGFEQWSGPLIEISGTDLTVTGPGATLNGKGADYWDGKGSTGGKTKPKFFYAHSMITSSISNLKIINAPAQVISITSCNHLTVTDVTIDNSAGDSLGANTDGFDIGTSTSITITRAIVKNQDDCVAINSGTGIIFSGGHCFGGHGLSIGSVGGRSDNRVDTVHFQSSSISNSQNGVHIKTNVGTTGTVNGVTYSDITLSGITDYGIIVDQAYPGSGSPTDGVKITNLILNGVTGTVQSKAVNIYIACGKTSCSGWTWTGVKVTGGQHASNCQNVPSGASC